MSKRLGWHRWIEFLRPQLREYADTFMASRSQLNQHLIRWLPDPSRVTLMLILAHYPATFERLQTALELAEVPYQIHQGSIGPAEICQFCQFRESQARFPRPTNLALPQATQVLSAPVYLALTGQLLFPPNGTASLGRRRDSAIEQGWKTKQANFNVGVMVAERHDSRADDDRVRNFCKLLQPRCELGFFVALDDPLLAGKVDPAMQQLLEHYGMKNDEPLQSLLLERLVRRVQRNATRRV